MSKLSEAIKQYSIIFENLILLLSGKSHFVYENMIYVSSSSDCYIFMYNTNSAKYSTFFEFNYVFKINQF